MISPHTALKPLLLSLIATLGLAACNPSPSINPNLTTQAVGENVVEQASGMRWDETNPHREIVEVFSYACIHCRDAEMAIQEWVKTVPSGINFVQIPAVVGGALDQLALLHFGVEQLKLSPDRKHVFKMALYDAILINKTLKSSETEDLIAWAAAQGIDPSALRAAMDSAEVKAQVERARLFAQRNHLQGTPSFIIDGRWHVNREGITGWQDVLDRALKGITETQGESTSQAEP